MINRKLNQIILALLIIGALVTFWTGETFRSLREQRAPAEKSLEESSAAQETKVEPAAGPSANVKKHSSGKYEEFRRKFQETETTLERLESGYSAIHPLPEGAGLIGNKSLKRRDRSYGKRENID